MCGYVDMPHERSIEHMGPKCPKVGFNGRSRPRSAGQGKPEEGHEGGKRPLTPPSGRGRPGSTAMRAGDARDGGCIRNPGLIDVGAQAEIGALASSARRSVFCGGTATVRIPSIGAGGLSAGSSSLPSGLDHRGRVRRRARRRRALARDRPGRARPWDVLRREICAFRATGGAYRTEGTLPQENDF